jgi:hypothetical protein
MDAQQGWPISARLQEAETVPKLRSTTFVLGILIKWQDCWFHRRLYGLESHESGGKGAVKIHVQHRNVLIAA